MMRVEYKERSGGLQIALTSFEFIVWITSLYRLLHPVASITQKLQGHTIDIVKAY